MRRKLNMILLAAAVASALCGGELLGRRASAQTPAPGTWTLQPAQSVGFATAVRPPIKADGTSVFNANTTSVIPVKFKLSTAPTAAILESNLSDLDENNDVSFLSFEPGGTLLFADISVLKAEYAFTDGNCGGGSLRWTVTFDINNDDHIVDEEGTSVGPSNNRSIFIYYGGYPNFDECRTGTNNQSNTNMIGLTDLRYDTSQMGGTFYDTYTNALAIVAAYHDGGPQPRVAGATLTLDSGWRQDGDGNFITQKLNLGGAQVNDNRFTPLSGDPAGTCNLPQATINITKQPGTPVEEPVSVRPRDGNVLFGKSGCQYIYNLDTGSLPGPGTYKVEAIVNGQLATGAAFFTLQ